MVSRAGASKVFSGHLTQMITLNAHLSVSKGNATILKDAQIECGAGECLTILGENGAGKSVLLRSLALIETGAIGTVEVLGQSFELAGRPLQAGPWPDLTLVLQGLALWPHLTARQNILLAWRERKSNERVTEAALEGIFSKLEIEELLDRKPNQMSGGQRQRVALARAFALQPRVLLLDEPSSALDARRSLNLAEVLQDLKASGVTIVMVTHNLGFADKVADRFAFVDGGRIVERGSWAMLSNARDESLKEYLRLNAVRL
jgi:ABC-type polar amino acid transport system ATPase subunit